MNVLMLVDPVQPIFDYKETGLLFVSVGLFIGSTILTYIIKNLLDSLKDSQEKNTELLNAINARDEKIEDQIKKHATDVHEQWSKMNEIYNQTRDNSLHITDIKEGQDSIQEQQTILATAQVKANENQQKVLDAFVRVLTEHARE